MEKEKIDKIIDRVKKLLELAKSPEPEEAKAALLKAQELMMKYNINLTDAELNERNTDSVVTKSYIFHKKLKRQQHHLNIASLLAHNFRTKTYYSNLGIYFVGFEEDATTCVLLMDFLVQFIENAFPIFLKEDKKKNPLKYYGEGQSYSKFIKRSWISGFVSGLAQAFEDRLIDKSYEIMVITPTAVEEAYNELTLRTVSHKPRYEQKDRSAYTQGFEKGKSCMDAREITTTSEI